MLNRIYALAKKEVRQLKRDTRMLLIIFLFPVLLLVIFGYAINFDVHHIKIAIYDRDKSEDTRAFINTLTSSSYFDLVGSINSSSQIKKYLDEQIAQAVIVFPEDMSRNLNSKKDTRLQILIDGVNGNTATLIMNYLNLATMTYSQGFSGKVLALTGRGGTYVPVDLEPVFWYNPSLDSRYFLIPGLIAMIMIITAVISISLSIVREKELGTIEQINVSPLSSIELILGKTVPYAVISLLVAVFILISGYFLFSMPIKGNLILLFLTTLVFIFASLSLGIFVSSVATNQQVAFQMASLISMLPSVILSGFIFPIESMPAFIQLLSNITPAKFYIIILRSILLKGVGLEAFWPQVIYLFIFSAIFLGLATLRNRKMKTV
ncbi:MAG: ABC transporter permease [Ignavibacteria bacterium]|jgi:ABC-2 type transport system permease protein|nr:ABC transporter permease [Ignavibacteria bacterium]MCU7503325.1 ABC transporter permease [Ignavibacteria bacterium]MCU7515729.1 ABC transporter permease [Ignavibacteria bacterium]